MLAWGWRWYLSIRREIRSALPPFKWWSRAQRQILLREVCAATSCDSAGRVTLDPEAVVDIAIEELMMASLVPMPSVLYGPWQIKKVENGHRDTSRDGRSLQIISTRNHKRAELIWAQMVQVRRLKGRQSRSTRYGRW